MWEAGNPALARLPRAAPAWGIHRLRAARESRPRAHSDGLRAPARRTDAVHRRSGEDGADAETVWAGVLRKLELSRTSPSERPQVQAGAGL